jgi:regulator of replication initiation timing
MIMNNLAEQFNEISAIDALSILKDALDRETDDYNGLIDNAEKLESENVFLKLQLSNLTKRLDDVIAERDEATTLLGTYRSSADSILENGKKLTQQVDNYQREALTAKAKFDDANEVLKAYKVIASTPKKMREKIKTLQENVAKQQGFVTQHKQVSKAKDVDIKNLQAQCEKLSRALDELDYTNVYSKDGDNVAIFPVMQKTNIAQGEVKQVPLLYLDDNGVGAIYLLNEDGEPSRSPTPKGGIKPKKETLEVMGTLLRKFKRNGNVVHSNDLKMLETV